MKPIFDGILFASFTKLSTKRRLEKNEREKKTHHENCTLSTLLKLLIACEHNNLKRGRLEKHRRKKRSVANENIMQSGRCRSWGAIHWFCFFLLNSFLFPVHQFTLRGWFLFQIYIIRLQQDFGHPNFWQFFLFWHFYIECAVLYNNNWPHVYNGIGSIHLTNSCLQNVLAYRVTN